jgi:hypothetical protein
MMLVIGCSLEFAQVVFSRTPEIDRRCSEGESTDGASRLCVLVFLEFGLAAIDEIFHTVSGRAKNSVGDLCG